MYNAISVEERGLPAAPLMNEGFIDDVRSAASGRGIPGIRATFSIVPCEATDRNEIEKGVKAAIDAIIDALTRPLTDEERNPSPREIEEQPRIIFKGDINEVNQFFYRRGWTDGLPVLPPTEAAVGEMLSGTDLPPDHLLGKLIPRSGKVTVEKIAVNAVMAGALPTYMPVLIAATKVLLGSEMGFMGFCTFSVSTGSWAPFWVVNGPIRNDLNLNNSSGALSPGNMPNAAIGRAMGLIIKNIGGIRKGVEDMGVMGNPMKYSMVLAENEEDSPWEPLHTEFGYDRQDSTIAISYPQTYLQHWPESTDQEGIMRSVIENIPRGMRYSVIFTPLHANILARDGWTKQELKEFICEYARLPGSQFTSRGSGPNATLFNGKIPVRNGDTIPQIRDTRFIRILVAGGPGAFIAHVADGGATPGEKEIEKIELPANWDKLVAKYKNMVPSYLRY